MGSSSKAEEPLVVSEQQAGKKRKRNRGGGGNTDKDSKKAKHHRAAKKSKLDHNKENRASSAQNNKDSAASSEENSPNLPLTTSWNQGVNTMLRTRLEIPSATMPLDKLIYVTPHIKLSLPVLTEGIETKSYELRAKDWTQLLMAQNASVAHKLTAAMVSQAFDFYVGNRPLMKKIRQKSTKAIKLLEENGGLDEILNKDVLIPKLTGPAKQGSSEGSVPAGAVAVAAAAAAAAAGAAAKEEKEPTTSIAVETGSSAAPAAAAASTTVATTDAAPVGTTQTAAPSNQPKKAQETNEPTASEWASLLEPPLQANGGTDARANTETETATATAAAACDDMEEGQVENTTNGDSANVVVVSQAMYDAMKLYFPGVADSTQICLHCATVGHVSRNCPRMACNFCKVQNDHFPLNCPTRTRCGKCRQLGHREPQCTEKLKLARGECVECAFCGEGGHVDEACDRIWRSYRPSSPSVLVKVKQLPAYCSMCGAQGHYSSECGLRPVQDVPSITWSLPNRDLYLDSGSDNTSIEAWSSEDAASRNSKLLRPAANTPLPPPPGAGVSSRGHSSANAIQFSETDDSDDVEFLGARVLPASTKPRIGRVRIASNISFDLGQDADEGDAAAAAAAAAAANNGTASQPPQPRRSQRNKPPPLPPGPPPAEPPSPAGRGGRGGGGRHHGRGGGKFGLPSKPPAASGFQGEGGRRGGFSALAGGGSGERARGRYKGRNSRRGGIGRGRGA